MKDDPQLLRDFVEAAKGLSGRMTELAAAVRGLSVNNVLHSGTVQIPAAGHVMLEFQVSMASVMVQASQTAGDITIAAATPTSPAPTQGIGVVTIGPDAMLCVPLVGTVLTVYGQLNDLVYVAVSSRPWPPAGA